MYWFLLKKALPFTLTFIFGAALSGLVGLFGSPEKKTEYAFTTRTYDYGGRCRSKPRRHHLVAESKPLAILNKPEAVLPAGSGGFKSNPEFIPVNVTFGADGKVQQVERPACLAYDCYDMRDERSGRWEAVERAARQIQFTPETINGVPVTVVKEVKIHLTFG
jgi:hypothetical protein